MKTPFGRDLLTGAVSLAGLVGLAVTLWLIGDMKEVFQRYYKFDLKLPAANGITSSSPVTYNGVRIGKVDESRLDPGTRGGVLVRLAVRQEIEIPDDFTVFIDRSFVGQTTVQLESPERPKDAPGAGLVLPDHVYARKSASLYDLITGPLKEPLEKFNRAADSFDRLATTYADIGADVKDALAPRTTAEVDSGAKAPNVRSVVARLDAAAGNLNKWLGDESLRTDARGVIAKADTFLDKANGTADAWTKAGQTVDAEAARLSAKIDAAAVEATGTLRRVSDASEQITQVTAGINRGEGTLGQLAKNPELYNSVKDAADRLERALRELQLLVQKYKDEGIPLKF